MEMDISLAEAFVYALDRLALALLIGCGASGAWLIAGHHQQRVTAAALRRLFTIALLLLTITTITVLLLRTASLADVAITETWPYLAKVITSPGFGALWLGRVAALVLLTLVWLASRKEMKAAHYLIVAAGGLITAFLISAGSHAGDEGAMTLDNLVNTAHITAGCLWGGAIIAYIFMLKGMRRYHTAIAESATRLSALATAALATVLTTGLINGWQRFESLEQLWSTGYGTTLLIKLGFVAVMMMIGAFNRFHAVPAIAQADGQARPALLLQRVLYLDAIVFLLVISAAALLAMQSPME